MSQLPLMVYLRLNQNWLNKTGSTLKMSRAVIVHSPFKEAVQVKQPFLLFGHGFCAHENYSPALFGAQLGPGLSVCVHTHVGASLEKHWTLNYIFK